MTTILIIYAALILWVLWLMATAPLGYEDAAGFRFGEADTAPSHCLTCSESVGWVTGPCAWSGCPLGHPESLPRSP